METSDQSRQRRRRYLPLVAAAALASSQTALAQTPLWPLCHAIDDALGVAQLDIDNEQAAMEIDADEGETLDQDTLLLQGEVSVVRGSQQLNADEVIYQRSSQQVQATGNIRLREPQYSLFGRRADLNVDTYQGEIEDAEFRFPAQHAHGAAKTIILDGREQIRLVSGSYTTCDLDDNSWSLRARRVKLDRSKDVGVARDATLRIKNVPVFYTPYISFPLSDKRKSGFLAPSFGSSDETGTDIFIPYYWNIAPNYDATITPRLIERRGTQLRNEFRYLSERHRGIVEAEYLPDDNVFGDDRSLLRLDHQSAFSPHWHATLLFAEVSDANYFQELGNSLSIAAITHLERRADLSYNGSWGNLLTRLQDFQTIDERIAPVNRPYRRLPQVLYNQSANGPWDSNSWLGAEWVEFDRSDSVTATRLDLQPGISRRFERSYGYFQPRLSLRHTDYQLNDQGIDIAARQSRTLPISSLDGGLFFDKPFSWGQRQMLHTLEPRLFYLYVPFRNQDDIPLFDSALTDFNFYQLFTENRFSGTDRVGDANQLSLALTSRLYNDDSGAELAQISIGQIRYFEDREVTLFGTGPDPDRRSDIVTLVNLTPNPRWRASGEWQWDPDGEESALSTFSLAYRPTPNRGVNLAYRSRRSQLIEQTDAAFFWPLTQHWRAVGRWNYSLEQSQTLESFAGVEYEQCCWRLALVHRTFVNNINGDSNEAIFLQLELKGLSRIGSRVDELLENGILDYRR